MSQSSQFFWTVSCTLGNCKNVSVSLFLLSFQHSLSFSPSLKFLSSSPSIFLCIYLILSFSASLYHRTRIDRMAFSQPECTCLNIQNVPFCKTTRIRSIRNLVNQVSTLFTIFTSLSIFLSLILFLFTFSLSYFSPSFSIFLSGRRNEIVCIISSLSHPVVGVIKLFLEEL